MYPTIDYDQEYVYNRTTALIYFAYSPHKSDHSDCVVHLNTNFDNFPTHFTGNVRGKLGHDRGQTLMVSRKRPCFLIVHVPEI